MSLDDMALPNYIDHASYSSESEFAPTETSGVNVVHQNEHFGTTNRALEVREKAVLEIDPLPSDILNRIDLTYSFKPLEKDDGLVTPIACVYQCEWEQMATVLEEKSDVWTGAEFGGTSWISSIRLGGYAVPCDESTLGALQGEHGSTATEDIVALVTGTRYTPSRSNTLGRHISSLINGGDNHISLLTAAYCALFDRLWCQAFKGERISTPSIPAEHRVITGSLDLELLMRELTRPLVVVTDNPRYVKFWKTVCGDGTDFSSVIDTGKKFVSPWASLGFKGLLKVLIVSSVDPDDSEGDMEYLDMQEALEDYITQHRLFSQALAAARLASRLPWLVKYKFVDALPQPIHCIDLLPGLLQATPELVGVWEDITRRHPPRFIIGTLLIAGHLVDTRFNHWRTENTDIVLAQVSAGASGRKSFHRWELGNRSGTSVWDTDIMKEINEIGNFLGRRIYSKIGPDLKFRNPGLNTSFWEAALLGPIAGTAAEAILGPQEPKTSTVGATVISVSSLWFAKVRASDMFDSRILRAPYNDFPFPDERVHFIFLNEIEQRVAYAQKSIPPFRLVKICFGRNLPIPAFQQGMSSLAPVAQMMGSRTGIRRSGVFREQYLSRKSIHDILKFPDQRNEASAKSETADGSNLNNPEESSAVNASEQPETDTEFVQKFIADGWAPTESNAEGEVVVSTEGNISAFNAFIGALLVTGQKVSFDAVIDIAKEGGWDESRYADFHELGLLCQHFEVEMVLETGLHGCFRFPARGKRGLAQVWLVSLKGKFGYIPARCKEKGSTRRNVRFAEMLE